MARTLASCAAALALAALVPPTPAHALVASTTTYYFSGACGDCTGTDTAELVLANYTPGNQISSSNFVSFHFDGSNLYGAFTITSPYSVFGDINPPLPSAELFQVYDYNNFFSSDSNGTWRLGANSVDDFGTGGVYSADAPIAAVPEPFSLTLMLTGLAGTALLRRRA